MLKKPQKRRDGSWKTDFSGEKSLLLYLLCCWWCGPKVVGIDKSAAVHRQKSPAPSRTRRPGSARTSRRTRHQSHKQRLKDIIKGETRTCFSFGFGETSVLRQPASSSPWRQCGVKSHTRLSSMHSPSPQANRESGHGDGGAEPISVREFRISFSPN